MKNKKYSLLSNILRYGFAFTFILSLMFTSVVVKADKPVDKPIEITSGIKNPIKADNLQDFIQSFIKGVLLIGIPILVLFIIYAGFLYVKAQGNPGELEVAHRTLLYTIIGAALLLGAFVIANAIVGTVSEIERNA